MVKRILLDNDAKWLSKFSKEEIKMYVDIGFCRPKFYKPSVWRKADRVMKIACYLGLAEPFNFGRGKGKYVSVVPPSEVVTGIREALRRSLKSML